MNSTFTPFAVLWALLALAVLALIGYRKVVASKDDETLRLSSANYAAEEAAVAHKLDVIDKWGKLLTVVAVVYGLLLAAIYTYQTFLSSGISTGL